MKVLIPCGGTRGDTQPCVALAGALRKAGHTIVIITPFTHAKLCRDQGFETVEVDFDVEPLMEEIMSSSDTKNFGAGLGFYRQTLNMIRKPEVQEAMKAVLPNIWSVAAEFKPDLIVTAMMFPIQSICEKLRIPLILVTYQAMAPTRTFPPYLVNSGKPLKWFPSSHKWLHQKFAHMYLKKSLKFLDPDDFGKNVLELSNSRSTELFPTIYEWVPTLIAAEPEVCLLPEDYGPQLQFTGWWFLDGITDNFTPSEELLCFLQDASRPPVVSLGFGSMKGNDNMSEDLTRIGLTALRAACLRGVLLGGWSGLTRERLGSKSGDQELKAWARENVIELKAVPHSWLFPKVTAVCHHGGAGTLAAGLRAGKSTVIVPFIADQPYWAANIEDKGIGRKGPHVSRLTAEVLSPLLKDVATNSAMQAKAKAFGEKIACRDSFGDALAYIDRFMKTYPYPWKVDCQEQSDEVEEQRHRAWPDSYPQKRCCVSSRGALCFTGRVGCN